MDRNLIYVPDAATCIIFIGGEKENRFSVFLVSLCTLSTSQDTRVSAPAKGAIASA